ncbi:vesicle fusion protein [Pelomyxa schiedti]|nr:vesicle fusion protein [Pelomyxa schiedti]
MLAFNIVQLTDKPFPFRVECLECWGPDRLLIGTAESALLLYDIQHVSDSTGYKMSLLCKRDNFAKKGAITQLSVVDEYGILVSLSDQVYVHDLPAKGAEAMSTSFGLKSALSKTKGCTTFSVQFTDTQGLVLIAGLKKHILIFTWDGHDFTEFQDYPHPCEPPKSIVWCKNSMCIGFKKEYFLMSALTGQMTEISNKTSSPLVTRLPDNQLLLAVDNLGVTVDYEGRPTRSHALIWTEPPASVVFAYPYAIAIAKAFLEIRTLLSDTLTQVLPIRQAKVICCKDLTPSAQLQPEAGKAVIYVATNEKMISRLVPVPLSDQIDQLCSARQYSDALVLCEALPEDDPLRPKKIESVRIQQAYSIFAHKGDYKEAMTMFFELRVPVIDVIGLFTNLLPQDLRGKQRYNIDLNELIGEARSNALKALCGFLVSTRFRVANSGPPAAPTPTTTTTSSSASSPSPAPNPGEVKYNQCTDIPTIIDTSLLKACIQAKEFKPLEHLLSGPNNCHLAECESFLLNDTAPYPLELVKLYKSKQTRELHTKALNLLCSSKLSAKENVSVQQTIDYLKCLGAKYLDLVLNYSTRVLLLDPLNALTIFTKGERVADDQLPSAEVLAHFRRKELAPVSLKLIVPYLEYLIGQGSKEPDIHNDLVIQYTDIIVSSPNFSSTSTTAAGTETGVLGETRKKLISFLETSKFYTAEVILSKFPEHLHEEKALLLARIGEHRGVLNIYATKLNQPRKAEEYCEQHYSVEESQEGHDVYLNLLEVYLRPDGGEPPMVKPAFELLNKHYLRINIPKALALLPQDTPLASLKPFFENVIRDTSKRRRSNQVEKGLRESENLQVRLQNISARARMVKIDESTRCAVCLRHLRLSAFALYPDGSVVHLMCMKNKAGPMGSSAAAPAPPAGKKL